MRASRGSLVVSTLVGLALAGPACSEDPEASDSPSPAGTPTRSGGASPTASPTAAQGGPTATEAGQASPSPTASATATVSPGATPTAPEATAPEATATLLSTVAPTAVATPRPTLPPEPAGTLGAATPRPDDHDGDGFTPGEGDCDDLDADTYPGAPERCEGSDNDCDGVAVPSAPLVASSGAGGCEGGSASLTATTITGATYSWSGPEGYQSTEQSPTLSGLGPGDAGVYTVTATVGACEVSSMTTLTVAHVDGGIVAPAVATVGLPVTFAPATEGGAYAWTFEGGDPPTSAAAQPSVTWAAEGIYDVSLTTTVGGCSASSEAIVEVTVPSQSCAALLAQDPSAPTGIHTLDPDEEGEGAPFDAWCEMGLDDGGWTLVMNLNTANGEISKFNRPIWTNTAETNTFANRFTGDYKSAAAEQLAGTELLVIVRDAAAAEGATPLGWRSWDLNEPKRFNDLFTVAMGAYNANSTGGCNLGSSGDGRRQTTGVHSAGVAAPFDPFTSHGDDLYSNSYYGGCGADQDAFRLSIWYRWANNSNVGLGLQMDPVAGEQLSMEAGSYMKIDTYTAPQRYCQGGCGVCTAYPDGSADAGSKTKVPIGTDHEPLHCSVGVSYRYEWYVR